MRVLLVSENRCRENLVPYPLGVACVAAATRQAGHEVACLDLMFSEHPVADVLRAIDDFRPDCIGLSIRNIDNQDMYAGEFYLPPVREIVNAVKEATAAPVILGGAGFTIFPRECLDYLDLEMGIVGEGERTFVELLSFLEARLPPYDLPGLAVRREGKSGINPPAPHAWPGLSPPPDRNFFDVARYNWTPGTGSPFVANLQARRGCHMHCIYCTNPGIEGRLVRARPPREVADELASLENDHGLRYAIFTDSLFNYPPPYAEELCREIASRDLSIRWWCNLNPLYCERKLLKLLREAGCVGMSIGNESGSEDILASLKKGFTREHVVRAVCDAHKLGFRTNCFLLLGGPGENESTVRESVELMEELAPTQVTVTVGIRVYPGCEIRELALREGMIEAGQNLLFPAFYLSREVEDWLYPYMRELCDIHPGWVL